MISVYIELCLFIEHLSVFSTSCVQFCTRAILSDYPILKHHKTGCSHLYYVTNICRYCYKIDFGLKRLVQYALDIFTCL